MNYKELIKRSLFTLSAIRDQVDGQLRVEYTDPDTGETRDIPDGLGETRMNQVVQLYCAYTIGLAASRLPDEGEGT